MNRALWFIFITPCSTGNHIPCVENHYHFPVEPFSKITSFAHSSHLFIRNGKDRVPARGGFLDCEEGSLLLEEQDPFSVESSAHM